MLYIKMIASKLGISIELASKIFDHMDMDFSRSSERKIISCAKEVKQILGL